MDAACHNPLRSTFAPYSQKSQPHQYSSFPTGMLLSTSLDPSVYTVIPAPMVSEQLSSRSSLTAPSASLSILAEQPSLTNGIGPPWNSRPDALCGVSVAYVATYLAFLFLIFTGHECLQQISKIGESKPHIQRWMEFISVYNYHLSYRRGRDNTNADFLSRLPIPPTTEDISGSSALTDPDDLGVYLIRACSYTSPSCPIPGVGLGGLTPPSDNNLGTAWHHSPTLVLGGLPLTQDDFRTHRAPMPLRRRSGPLADAFIYTTHGTYPSYTMDDQLEPTRTTRAGRTRSRTAILADHTPLRPGYHRAARSGFAAPAAPALPPRTQPRSSPLPRSDRLGSTTPLGRPDLCRPPPAQNSKVDTTPPASHTNTEDDTYAATKQLSSTLLSYSHGLG